jgi:hypothetical protein
VATRAAADCQSGDEVRGIWRGQLAREEGEVPSKEIGGGLTPVAARRWSGGVALRGGGRLRWSWHGGHRRRGPSPAPRGKREEGEVRTKEGEKGNG